MRLSTKACSFFAFSYSVRDQLAILQGFSGRVARFLAAASLFKVHPVSFAAKALFIDKKLPSLIPLYMSDHIMVPHI